MQIKQTVERKGDVKNGIGRLFIAVLAILVQVALMVTLLVKLDEQSFILQTILSIIALAIVLGISNMEWSSAVKLPWIIILLLFPIFGVILFFAVGTSGTTRRMKIRFAKVDARLFPMLRDDTKTLEKISAENRTMGNIFRYTSRRAGYPVYENSDIVFYGDTREALEAQKEELRKARYFIFMEYHAIEDAEAFREIRSILAAKAKAGVDVRIFYDDVGSIGFINHDFIRRMKKLGIKCRVFNPVMPVVNTFINNRDHRKITVIDGKVGFTGGYNLCNEYFGITRPYGTWKDTGVKITGEAVRTLTTLFLEMWNAIRGDDKNDKFFSSYFPEVEEPETACGYIQPYGDTPLDSEHVGENVYLNIINSAERYLWITTPYLIISDEMNCALSLAVARGVDVRIITPGIPDKKIIYHMTRSYYPRLVRAGVKIYEFLPGFCHAKQCVADDRIAACGTINFDYRSLYHHFENGCIFCNTPAVQSVRKDFEQLFPQCLDVSERYRSGLSKRGSIMLAALRLFAPLF